MSCFIVCLLLDVSHFTYFSIPIDYPLRGILVIFGLSFTITFLIFRTIPYLIFICLFSDYPGQCPVQNYFAVTCNNFCTSDVDCLKNYKCCGTENCGEQTQCVPGKKSLYNTGILTWNISHGRFHYTLKGVPYYHVIVKQYIREHV